MIYFVDHYLPSRICIPHVNILPSRRAINFIKNLHEIFTHFYNPLVSQIENSADINYEILRDNVGR